MNNMDRIENLTYKTPNNINPTGLPKIYFSCHPKDFKKFFPKISEVIWKQQNCAILYKSKLNKDSQEELLEYLKENAYLFVFPVTSNLLKTENYSLSQDFAFARENGIPILPLFEKTGLEDLFNEKCGNYQCLLLNDKDTTSLEFKTKLETFLSETLVDNDLLDRIQKEFKKRVFISYRKMDRFHVNKLIEALYENEKFRDVAIWYDEYLTPGENFNENIQTALIDSDLVILATTPNVIEKTKNSKGETVDNYIITSEYPMVENKIIGVELVQTDKDKILSTFPKLKNLIGIEEKDKLNQALNLILGLNNGFDNTPQHKFLIGLAYLNGISVPTNRHKGISLLKEAAEDGSLEAMQKLIAFYFNGQFVEQSYEKAMELKKTLINSLKEYYYRTKNITRGHEYAKTLWDLIADEIDQRHLDQRHLDDTEALLKCLDEFCKEFIKENGETREIVETYKGYLINSGDYYLRKKDSDDDALQCFFSALKITDDDPKVKALCLDRIGKILLKTTPSKAKPYIEEALEIRKKLKSDFDSNQSAQKRNLFQNEQYEYYYLEATRNLSESHESMALLHTISNNQEGAISEYEKSIPLRMEIYSRGKLQADLVLLIQFQSTLAKLRFDNEDYEKALLDFLSLEKLLKDNRFENCSENLDDIYSHIACCYLNISDACAIENNVNEAYYNLIKTITYLKLQLNLLPIHEQARAYSIHDNMALAMLKFGTLTKNKETVDSARKIWESLSLMFPDNFTYKSMINIAENTLEDLDKK